MKKNVILFFVIALAWSDGIWILLNAKVQLFLGIHLSLAWAWLGLMGPGLAAIVMAGLEGRLNGLKKLFNPLLKWRVPLRYYLLIYFSVFIFYCIASWLSILIYKPADIKSISWLYDNITSPFFNLHGVWVLVEITVIYTFCEELGWRGYALPNMTESMSVLVAAIIIGFFWTIWHIPLIYLYGSSLDVGSTLNYFLHIECMSIFYTWLYFKTDKSLLLVGLLHGATDGIGMFFPLTNSIIGQGPNGVTVLLELIIAAMMVPYLLRVKKIRSLK